MLLPALLLKIGGSDPKELYASKCVRMTMDDKRQVRITAKGGSTDDASCAMNGVMESTSILLKETDKFSVLWDLRDSPNPSIVSTARLVAWGIKNKARLESHTQKMGVLVGRGMVAEVVQKVLNAFAGAVPTMVSTNEKEVEAFVLE